jgi:hypothetical protein
MSKSTTLIVAAIGLGGLGYFLYKKGLFSNKLATAVVTDTKITPSPAPIPIIPAIPEKKIMPIDPIVNIYPLEPIEVVIDPYVGKPSLQNKVPITIYPNDPFINNNNGGSVNKNLNQLLYL